MSNRSGQVAMEHNGLVLGEEALTKCSIGLQSLKLSTNVK